MSFWLTKHYREDTVVSSDMDTYFVMCRWSKTFIL